MRRKRLTKEQRQRIYDKTDGRCAYCGCKLKLEEMQVDHIKALACGGEDNERNMLSACRSCNHRKDTSDIESFRRQVERYPQVLLRDSVTYRAAVRYGLVVPNPAIVKFYFEMTPQEKSCRYI